MNKIRKIKNWSDFQHYKSGDRSDRAPDWIKVYRRLLDDLEWHKLPGDDAKLLVELWMLAAENGGTLPCIEKIAFRLRRTEKSIKSMLDRLPHWIEDEASGLLADGYQPACLEVEGEEELEENKKVVNGHAVDPLDDFFPKSFENYNRAATVLGLPKAEKITPTRKTKLKARLREHGLVGWNRALQNIAEMPFCCGENDRGWRVNLDWLLEPSNFNKVLEMAYERPAKGD